MGSNYKTILFKKQDNIGILTINRPEKLNALNGELFSELRDFFTEIRKDFSTRVIVLNAAGKIFCAGWDLGESFYNSSASMGVIQNRIQRAQQVDNELIRQMRSAPQPIIGAIRGAACGGGFSLVMACDMLIAGESAKFNAAYVKVGFCGGDLGSSYYLPRLIGLSRAAEYLYTGRFIDAVTAERFGLVSRVVKDDQVDATAMELAMEIAQNSPMGIRCTKEAINCNIDAPSLESALQFEIRQNAICVLTDDLKEGVSAAVERRKPVYKDH